MNDKTARFVGVLGFGACGGLLGFVLATLLTDNFLIQYMAGTVGVVIMLFVGATIVRVSRE